MFSGFLSSAGRKPEGEKPERDWEEGTEKEWVRALFKGAGRKPENRENRGENAWAREGKEVRGGSLKGAKYGGFKECERGGSLKC